MESVAEDKRICQEKIEESQTPYSVEEFFDNLEYGFRRIVRTVLMRAIRKEFEDFIGTVPYGRNEGRVDYRNGFRNRNFETRFGLIKDIIIPNYYKFPYRHWSKIRTTNVIERVFREFRRKIRVMDSFPNEDSCIRILFGLVRLLNEGGGISLSMVFRIYTFFLTLSEIEKVKKNLK